MAAVFKPQDEGLQNPWLGNILVSVSQALGTLAEVPGSIPGACMENEPKTPVFE